MTEAQSADISDPERDEGLNEDVHETHARVVSDDEDYSSDSSEETAATVTGAAGDQAQQRAANQRQSRNRAAGAEPLRLLRESAYPVEYRFVQTTTEDTPAGEHNAINDEKRVGLKSLGGLVKYSSTDLLMRAWYLCPTELKTREYPLYSKLPKCPEVMETRFVDTDEISQFMCTIALQLGERYHHVTPVYLRSLLVQAVVRDEIAGANQGLGNSKPFSDALLNPVWEDVASREDGSGDSSDETDDDDDLDDTVDSESAVSAFDFSVALVLPAVSQGVASESLRLLHSLVDRCLASGTNVAVLRSWGVKRIMLVLLRHMYAHSGDGDSAKWTTRAISLLSKIVFTSGDTKTFLALLRWSLQHSSVVANLPMRDVRSIVQRIEQTTAFRVRLSIPTVPSKEQTISLLHSVGGTPAAVKGVCVFYEEDAPRCIVFTENRSYKVALTPPFDVLCWSSSAPDSCRGVYVEENMTVSVLGDDGKVFVFDKDTLMVTKTLMPPASLVAAKEFPLYLGNEEYTTPFFLAGASADKHACFTGDDVSGTLLPSSVSLPRTCESVSVQFYMCPIIGGSASEMTVLQLSSGSRSWLTVTASLNPLNSTMVLTFRHGQDTVAEVRESLKTEWALWSASLLSVNDTASWTVYKNGVVCEARSQSGAFAQPSSSLTPVLFKGRASAFFSTLQLWSRAQNIEVMRSAALDHASESKSQFLVFSFLMDEGLGCSLHSPQTGYVWQGSGLRWDSPLKPFPATRHGSRRVYWRPSGDYYVVSNLFEYAVVEPQSTTWIDRDGRVVEQDDGLFSVSERPFYNLDDGCFFLSTQEAVGIRSVRSNSPPAAYLKQLPSMTAGKQCCAQMLEAVRSRSPISAQQYLEYLVHRSNLYLLTRSGVQGGPGPVHLSSSLRENLSVVGRLLDMAEHLVAGIEHGTQECLSPELVLCFIGRLLNMHVKLFERQCPGEVVRVVVDVHRRLQELNQQVKQNSFLHEAASVFGELHKTVLACCVSHDFQLKLINESASLKDVRQLLMPESLSQFVASVIQKDMKKMFMTFLHRLKDECQEEAVCILDKRPRQLAASEAMLSTLLGMLSQQEYSQWHLVAAALISSLCKWIVRCYEERYATDAERVANVDVLKGTSIGIVLFPVVHYMCDMQLESAIAPDALKALNDARKCLARYTSSAGKEDTEVVSFTETHYVVSPPQLTAPFTANLSLQYAKSIVIEYGEASEAGERSSGRAAISLITNNCLAFVEVLSPGQQAVFQEGARISITCGADATPEAPVSGVSLSVHTAVELRTEKTDWMRDICLALSSIIIRVTQHNLHNSPPSGAVLGVDSFLRGGPSAAVQKRHRIAPAADEKEECVELHAQLCAVAAASDSALAAVWTAVYERSRIQYAGRLETIMRWAACAVAWQTLPFPLDDQPTVERLLVAAVDRIKRKTFLLLEALQQGREDAIVDRARFLLYDVAPRVFAEAQLAENQHTEEPVTAEADRGSRQQSRLVYSLGHRSRAAMASFPALAAQTLDFSSGYRGALVSARKTATRMVEASPVNIFSKAAKTEEDCLPNKIVYYLINGMEKSTEALLKELVLKTQQTVYQTAAYQLQDDLCKSFAHDREMLASILMTHLRYRLDLSQAKMVSAGEAGDDEGETKVGFSHHYTEQVIGCGMLREVELQRAVCAFVQSSLRALLHKLDDTQSFPYAEAVYMCATLCHPWDGVDMSILQPREIFAFLKKLFTTAYGLRLDSTSPDTEKYFESHGLFDLAHRCLITPNAMLQTSVEGVHVVQSEVQGLHVENVNIVFSARTHWKAHGHNTKIPAKSEEVDYYANYGVPCVISEYPDVQYFEVTLDFALHPTNAVLQMGLSLVPLSPLDPVRADYVISLASSGRVHNPEKQDFQLSSPWKVGDVIGCGLMAPSNSVFFTQNGEFLGVVAEMSSMSTAIPFISVQGDDTLMKVIVNFGEEQPFKFDLASLHCSSRHRYLTPATVCDTVLITTAYLVTMCYKDLSSESSSSATNGEAISGLLERAASFLSSAATALMAKLSSYPAGQNARVEVIVTLLSRILHCVSVVIECFRYDSVTPRTHAMVLQLCAVTLTRCRDKWVKVRASHCLTMLCKMLRPDYLIDASESLRGIASSEDIVQQLVDLARVKLIKEVETPMQPPRWVGDTTVVKGKGTFFGSVPLPKKGTHLVGFRIKRRQQQVQGPGAPLGGCYYLGLAHGQPAIPNMGNLISRSDVFVLQDTDDQDQVSHLLLRRHCIPRNNHRRVYGNDEVVWVELNADYGEITFYRENMVMIGLAFANITQVDDLYPIAFLFNDDASCEIIAPPSISDESVEHWTENLRRSTAVDALQELHMVPGFSPIISRMVQRSISQLDRGLDACLVALGVLGGERSYRYCQHDTFGMVVVHAIADVTGKVVVYLASDEDRRLFSVQPHGLKPSFIQTPLYQSGSPDAHACASLLSSELYQILYEASAVAPLLHSEEEHRREVEAEYRDSLSRATAMNLIGILTEQRRRARPMAANGSLAELGGHNAPFQRSGADVLFTGRPVAVDLHCSTKTLYVPNPSVAVTTAEGCSVVRGNVLRDTRFTLAVSVTQTSANDLMYVGFSTTQMRWPETQDEVASWDDAWALCNRDSAATNSVNCCMEPGIIFGAAEKLFQSGDVLLMRVNRLEKTIAFTRIRGGEQTDLGVLFDGVPPSCDLRPIVVCGEETVVVFSTLNACLFPARVTYPVSNFNSPARDRPTCCACARRLSPPWYGSEESIALCETCFSSWKRPKDMFFAVSAATRSTPEYLVSDHCPESLRVGEYVEFEENAALDWSEKRSVNAEVLNGTCIALSDECFAFSEELSQFGQRRVDVRLSHATGVLGHPFSGLHSFTPLWRDGQHIRATCTLRGDCVAVSATLLPMRTKSFLHLHIDSNTRNTLFSMTEVFVGVTNLSDTSRPMSRSDLEQLCGSKNAWGAWCDTSEKVNGNGDVFILVDCLNNSIFLSSTLSGLQSKPFVISGSISADADEDNLRLLVFSHDPCFVESREGLVSYNECVEPSFAPVAVGLFPESSDVPSVDTFNDAVVLMDTVDRTQAYIKTEWTYTAQAERLDSGTLFYIGDTVTFLHDGRQIRVYVQGIHMASLDLKEEQRSERLRVVAYLSTRGTTATLVPPLYGTSHLGRVLRVCGADVAVVETVSESGKKEEYAVNRSAVRFCALVASAQDEHAGLRDGDPVAFKIGGLQISKRGSVASVQGNVVNVCESSDKRNLLSINVSQCFSLRNEGKQRCHYTLYPLISPPTSSITRVFEVGKKKFRLQSRGSYNGIMFDCKTNETIEIIGLSVLTRVTGCHQVQTFFRKGSSANHERDGRSWTMIFEDMIDMMADHQFSIPLAPIIVEGNTTFSFYINTSHNCGIGFYCEEDGCVGEIGQELDTDGTLSVCLGRKSGSSDPFTEFSMSPRGFCGTLQYKQNHGSSLPSIEGKLLAGPALDANLRHCSDSLRLICRPPTTTKDIAVTFRVRVLSLAVRIISFALPVLLLNPSANATQGISHCSVSMFYSQEERLEWQWIWNSRFLVVGDSSEAVLSPSNLCLEQGTYTFQILLKNIESDGAGAPPHLCLLSSSDAAYERKNGLIAVDGFFGDVTCEANTPVLEGELHTMTTGAHLNQSNSASYNGIMFDVRSKKEITLEEVFCVSQTTSDRVTVRIFWKEGSMEGAEKAPHQWREVLTKEVAVVDKHPFSAGPLMLRMRANQVYSIFINTSSSCGVRFYNSSDGHVGDIRDEFDSDGILSVYVGRKSESSSPFVELPLEPRAFRGRITYRTYALQNTETTECAIFPYVRGYLVTRMLVALMSYVELSAANYSASFSYERLLKTIALLATSPMESLGDLMGAENMLATLIRSAAEIYSAVVTIPITANHGSLLAPLAKGDLALLTETQSAEPNALVRLHTHVQQDGTAMVHNLGEEQQPFRVPAKRLLPVIKCVACGGVYGQGVCAVGGAEHVPLVSEDARAVEIVANGLRAAQGGESVQEAVEAAVAAVGSARRRDGMLVVADVVAKSKAEVHVSVDARGVSFSVPVSLFLSEEEYSEGCGVLCPFVFHPVAGAAVSLRVSSTNDAFAVEFVTDGAAGSPAPPRCLYLCLSGGVDEAREALTQDRVPFVLCPGGESRVVLVDNVNAGYAASLQRDGVVVLFLEIQACAPFPVTAPVEREEDCWVWENNSVETQLSSTAATYLQHVFSPTEVASGWPHFSSFMVSAKGKETTIFLELHVAEVQRRTLSSSGIVSRSSPPASTVRIRKPFNVQSGEALTMRVTTEGDFFLYDTNDIVRCSLSKEELYGGKYQRQLHRIGFVSVDPEKATAVLYVPEKTRRNPRVAVALDHKTTASAPTSPTKTYSPSWIKFDPNHTTVTRNGLTASSVNEMGGGDAVLGTPLPTTGVSSFVVHIHRKDCQPGTPLGSGFFAGVAVTSFAQLAPEYTAIKTSVGSLWVVQDVQDDDSMANQELLPPLMRSASGQRVLFCDSTKIVFIVDRSNGTLSISRDNESPQVVFQGIPQGVSISPFVRLDHPNSSATLARFSSAVEYARLHQPALEKVLSTQPITPSLLRRYPLFMVMQTFPFLADMVGQLPTRLAGVLERCWGEQTTRSRFEYRLSQALEELTELGAFARSAPALEAAQLDGIVAEIVKCSRRELVVFPAGDCGLPAASPDRAGEPSVMVRLPPTYELVGRVASTNMARVLYFDPEFGAVERTLHLFRTSDPQHVLHSTNSVLPHLSVMWQQAVLPSLNDPDVVAVITDGWFDCTLESFDGTLDFKAQQEIASSLVYAVEHWHLHQLAHGHVQPSNLYLRVVHGEVVQCCLWDVHYLAPSSRLASHELRDSGVRSLYGDRWGCWRILHSFEALLAQSSQVAECVELMVDEATSISRALQMSEAFQDTFSDTGEGPTFSLRTGSRLRGGSGSYNGIMFDVVAKNNTVRITKLSFIPDTNAVATVRLYTRTGTFMGYERDAEAWTKLVEEELSLKDTWEVTLENFEPITVPAGSRVGIFLHTTSGSGVLFFSENEGLQGKTGDVEEENDDIGITVGKKSESANPFVAVQSQKRLLKGSITYTVLMRSNGPRSRLIYSAEVEAGDGKLDDSVGFRLVQVDESRDTHRDAVLDIGAGMLRDTSSSELFTTEQHMPAEYRLQVVDPAATRHGGGGGGGGGGEVLVLVAPHHFEWRRSSEVIAVRPDSLEDAAAALVGALRQDVLQRRTALLQQHDPHACAFPCRPLMFTRLEDSVDAVAAASHSSAVTHPLLAKEAVLVSEPISRTCTLSFWQKLAGAVSLVVLDHYPTAEEMRASAPSTRELLVGAKSHGGFVYVDDALRSVTAARDRTQLRLRRPLAESPVYVVARLRSAGYREVQLFAYTSAVDSDLLVPIATGCYWMRSVEAVSHAAGAFVALERDASGAEEVAGSAVHLQALVSSRTDARFVRLPRGADESESTIEEKLRAGDALSSMAARCRVPPTPLLVEFREQVKWKSVQHVVDFTCLSSSLAVAAAASVRQVTGGLRCAGAVASPRFSATERHRVLLRLQFPRTAPIELRLECKNTSATPIRIAHGSYNALRNRLLDPPVREVFLYLDVNLQTREIVAITSDGTVCHPVVEESASLSDTQLGFVLSAPGSQLDVVEWKVCAAQVRGEMNAPAFKDVLADTRLAAVSGNVALTVGTVCRHSARGALPVNRENNLSTEKQMEVLMVTYARILLEKTLLSQEQARAAIQPHFLRLLSFTALRTHPDISRVLDSEIRHGSFRLVCQSIAHLCAPLLLQVPAEVETSVNVIASLMRNDTFRRAIPNAFGTTLVLVLLRTATVYTRSTRHAALHCVQELLADERIPLPTHKALTAHIRPLTDMMAALCRGQRMGSAVVQTGVTLIADLIERYQRERPAQPYRDAPAEIPYKLVMCAREVVRTITHEPPLPLPAAMVMEVSSHHTITCEVATYYHESENRTSASGVFTEEGRDDDGSMSFTVVINGNRHGAVIVGWNSATRHGQQDTSLPCFGYFIDARTGGVFLCYGHTKSFKGLSLRVNAGDEIVTCANYRDHRINFEVKRGGITVGETKFDTEREVIGLPFYAAEHSEDATVDANSFRPGPQTLSIPRLYEHILQPGYEQDAVAPQSYDFYAELNLFAQSVLDVRSSADLVSRLTSESTVASHELASYTQVSSVLSAGAFAGKISLLPLQPYFVRLKKMDELTAEFAPLINLRRRTELFEIFGVLKNLCSRATEEQIQTRIMTPFQHRQGKKVSVTIHTMQAQPTSTTGAFPTLARSVFGQLYLQLQQATIDTFFVSPIFTVKLAGFGSTDAGGPYRDVLSQLATEIMTTHPSRQFQLNPLFVNCGRGEAMAIMPNVALLNSAQTSLMLEFFGKLLASFFLTQDLLAVELPPLFWKLLLGEEATIKDLATLDSDIAKLLQPEELMMRTQEELEERFPGITEMWRGIADENQQFLLDENLPPETEDGARLLSRRIVASEIERFAEAIAFIQQGFDQVLPLYTLQAYRWQKVELLICGTPKLTFADFRNECDIQLNTPDAAMFLAVLEGMTDEDRTSLLRFTTGQSRLPLKTKIKVTHNGNKDTLPTSSTCFFALRLPSYSSAEKMKERLLYAVRQCKAIDADGQAREHLIID